MGSLGWDRKVTLVVTTGREKKKGKNSVPSFRGMEQMKTLQPLSYLNFDIFFLKKVSITAFLLEITTQPPRVRQFCVEIAPPYDWRNIDAALLREHSVRRICASYKVLQICANLMHVLTYASNLRKKSKKICACAKKKFKPATFNFAAQYSNHSATLSS